MEPPDDTENDDPIFKEFAKRIEPLIVPLELILPEAVILVTCIDGCITNVAAESANDEDTSFVISTDADIACDAGQGSLTCFISPPLPLSTDDVSRKLGQTEKGCSQIDIISLTTSVYPMLPTNRDYWLSPRGRTSSMFA